MATMCLVRALIVGLALVCSTAWAEDEFRKNYEAGLAAYELGEFVRAAEFYKAAHRVRRDPALLYNIGQAYRLAGNLEQSVFFYRSYLRAMPNPPNRRDLEERIRTLDAQIASQRDLKNNKNALAPPTVEKPTPVPGPVPTTPTVVARPERKPLVKQWWLWTAVGGGVVLAVGLGVGLGLGLQPRAPSAEHSFNTFPLTRF